MGRWSMPEPTLKPYIVHVRDMPEEGAALVFAHSAREAKRMGFDTIAGWFTVSYIEIVAHRLRRHEAYLRTLATSAEPHVIESPPSCRRCELWGNPIDGEGICVICREAEDVVIA